MQSNSISTSLILLLTSAIIGFIFYIIETKLSSITDSITIDKNFIYTSLFKLEIFIVFGLILILSILLIEPSYILWNIWFGPAKFSKINSILPICAICFLLVAIVSYVYILILGFKNRKKLEEYEFNIFAKIRIGESPHTLYIVKELSTHDFLAVHNKDEFEKKEFIYVEKREFTTGTKIKYAKFK